MEQALCPDEFGGEDAEANRYDDECWTGEDEHGHADRQYRQANHGDDEAARLAEGRQRCVTGSLCRAHTLSFCNLTQPGTDGNTPAGEMERRRSRRVPESAWNPEQYERFREERSQPFFDLLALVRPRPNFRVVDLGCGTGELTRHLHRALAARETLGVDSSASMLAKSAAFAGDGLRFTRADLTTFAPAGAYDLIFSNAVLHWVANHVTVLRRLTGLLAARGQLAVQVPANHDHPSHIIAAAVAAEPPFRDALRGYVRPVNILTPEGYAQVLHDLGYREQHVRLQVYAHRLPSRDDVVEWVKGTLLVDYEQRLSAELFTQYLQRYRARLLAQLDDTRPFFYPFKRILFWGAR